MTHVYQVLLPSKLQLNSYVSLINIYCLRLFVIVYKDEILYIASELVVCDT